MQRAIEAAVDSRSSSSRPALIAGERSWTAGALAKASRRYAGALAGMGFFRGDRVAVFADTAPELVIALLGHLRAGLVHVPINPAYREDEARHLLVDSGAAAVLVAPGSPQDRILDALGLDVRRIDVTALPEGGALADVDAGDRDPALLIYTSGTTGRSKGVELSRAAVAANLGAMAWLWRMSEDDRVVVAPPLFHVHGLGLGVIASLISGATILLEPRFDAARVVDAFASRGATVFMGVPTMYVKLLDHLASRPDAARALANGRLFTAGSAALASADFAAFEERTGHRILERYGMSETLFTLSNPYDGERRPGSVGLTVPGVDIRIAGESGEEVPEGELGELLVKGSGLMTRYRNRPDETSAAFAANGFLRTGDVVSRGAGGYLTIAGRKSVDILKSGGFKVSAREIEDVLRSHPAVRDAAVVGLPDRVWGERVVAAVVLSSDAEPSDIEAFAADRLADYKRPRLVRVVEELPRNALGKVQKHVLVKAMGD